MMLAVIFILLSLSYCAGFVPFNSFLHKSNMKNKFTSLANDDGPSDIEQGNSMVSTPPISSSSENTNNHLSAKEILMRSDLISGKSYMSKSEINENICLLEKSNPTNNPAYSPLINGVWELAISGFGSPGLIGFQILKSIPLITTSDLTITISSMAPRVIASGNIKIGNIPLDYSISTDLVAISGTRMSEKYVGGKIANSLDIPFTSLPSSSLTDPLVMREILITYIDDDLLIVRDSLGSPEVLIRKNYANRGPSEGEAS